MDWRLVFLTVIATVAANDDKDKLKECDPECSCASVQGRPTMDCTNRDFNTIPQKIPPKTMTLLLDGNNFGVIRGKACPEHAAKDIISLHLANCRISSFKKAIDVFANMNNLEYLDLSTNLLNAIPSGLLTELKRLKRINLSNNHLKAVNGATFNGLTNIQVIDLSKNQIDFIDDKAFGDLPLLKEINLGGNKLFWLSSTVFSQPGTPALNLVNLQNNIWACDCHLRDLVRFVTERFLAEPATCMSPPKHKDKTWNQLRLADQSEFACVPKIKSSEVKPRPSPGEDVTFTCTVSGDPKPSVYWEFRPQNRSEKLLLDGKVGKIRFMKHQAGPTEWRHTLTVQKVSTTDQGHYMCIATNPADTAFELFQLELHSKIVADRSGEDYLKTPANTQTAAKSDVLWSSDMLLVVIIICVALTVVLVIISVLYCYRRQLNGTTPVTYTSINGYGYHVIDGNVAGFGQKQTLAAANNYYMPSPRTYYEADFVPVCMDKRMIGSVVSVQPDDSGYLESTGSQPSPKLHCPLNTSPNQMRNSLVIESDSEHLKRYSFPNGKAPLASEENEESKLPLRETAL